MSEFEFLRPCADAMINQIRKKKCVSRILTVTARPRYRVGDDPLFAWRATRRYGPLSQACLLQWRPCGRRRVQLNNMQVIKKNTADASTKCTQDPFKQFFSTLIRKENIRHNRNRKSTPAAALPLCSTTVISTPAAALPLCSTTVISTPPRMPFVDSTPADCSLLQNSGRQSSLLGCRASSMEQVFQKFENFRHFYKAPQNSLFLPGRTSQPLMRLRLRS